MRLTLTIAAVLSISWLAAAPGVSAARSLAPVPGRPPAPPLALRDLDGHLHRLQDYRGQVVVINFWATWCPPCRREIPSMQSIYKDLGDSGFTVLAVNEYEDPDHVFAYTGQLNVFPTFPILFDRDSAVSQVYKVKGLPTTVLIDKQGRIVYRAVGGRDFDHPEVRRIVSELLSAD